MLSARSALNRGASSRQNAASSTWPRPLERVVALATRWRRRWSLGPLAVPEGLDDLPVPDAHEVHAPVVLGAGDPPADDGAVAVDVDVLDRELDGGVGGQPLPAGEAFVVARPTLPSGAGPVPSITQSAAMRSTSFSGARSRNAALYWSMIVAVSVMAASSAASGALRSNSRQGMASRPGRAMITGDDPVPERSCGAGARPAG